MKNELQQLWQLATDLNLQKDIIDEFGTISKYIIKKDKEGTYDKPHKVEQLCLCIKKHINLKGKEINKIITKIS